MKLIANLSAIDRMTVEEAGIPSLVLMEEAGQQVARQVMALAEGHLAEARVVLLCGPGNNGGDGFVCARHLARQGVREVMVVLSSDPAKLTGDAQVNYNILNRMPSIKFLTVSLSGQVQAALRQADIVVDALFGSGLARTIEGETAELIRTVNRLHQEHGFKVVAVDIPSGVESAGGRVLGVAIEADCTVTFATAKPGLYLFPGKSHAGRIVVADIGIPPAFIERDGSPLRLLTDEFAAANLIRRRPDGHKYTFGHVMVVGGSYRMPGAAVLAAEAALASGTGLVMQASPQSVFNGSILVPPELLRLPLPETEEGWVDEAAADLVLETIQTKRINALVIGPGLGHTDDTILFVARLLQGLRSYQGTVVVDADGLNCLASIVNHALTWQDLGLAPRYILTPHLGEAGRLDAEADELLDTDPVAAARMLREKSFCQVVLKSATTIVAGTDGLLWINPAGNSGMATAGSGDVLSGMIAGLAAQGVPPAAAGPLGVYLHGLAGDQAAARYTMPAMKAGDITRCLPEVFRRFQEVRGRSE